jgi:microcystin-dependent protein
MADPFLSEIRMFSFNFAPKGWALCNGQTLPINQNQALFALLGTTYGGNGTTTFALPDLRGRVPIHEGNGHTLGERAGSSTVTITQQTMAQHIHVANAISQNATTNDITDNSANDALLAQTPTNFFNTPSSLTSMNPAMITNFGGSQPHENRQPFLTINFSIALQGIFPSQN